MNTYNKNIISLLINDNRLNTVPLAYKFLNFMDGEVRRRYLKIESIYVVDQYWIVESVLFEVVDGDLVTFKANHRQLVRTKGT